MSTEKVGYTETGQDAFARLLTIDAPSAEDLKLLMFLEASGKSAYTAMARGTTNDVVKRIFDQNGREELAHAVRLKRVIKLVHGEDVTVPSDAENPFCQEAHDVRPVTKEMLEMIVGGEAAGGDFYDRWAAAFSDAEVVKLLRQNGDEERRHGVRLREAVAAL